MWEIIVKLASILNNGTSLAMSKGWDVVMQRFSIWPWDMSHTGYIRCSFGNKVLSVFGHCTICVPVMCFPAHVFYLAYCGNKWDDL